MERTLERDRTLERSLVVVLLLAMLSVFAYGAHLELTEPGPVEVDTAVSAAARLED
jgi:hypothetical protein